MSTRVLILDDEPRMGAVLARMLAREGFETEWTDDGERALALAAAGGLDVIVSDLRMPGLSGLEVLARAKRADPDVDFVMMTAYATPQTAVEAMKLGAIDYLIKPFGVEELAAILRRVESSRAGAGAGPGAPAAASDVAPPAAIPTRRGAASAPPPSTAGAAPSPAPSPAPGVVHAPGSPMADLLSRARRVAASGASVLVRGESGTGKEAIARAIHSLSPRAARPLVVVNCGAIPESLMESQLFGHAKGAFTGAVEARRGFFEAAAGGTIFLDEVGELPLHLQVKLLRVLQEGEVQRVGENTPVKIDVRVVAATNRDLEKMTADGGFRQDLYYRLNVIPLALPPLRQRPGDLPALIDHFLAKFAPAGRAPMKVGPAAMALLTAHGYPGNIRELENAIEHATVLAEGDVIEPGDLPMQIQAAGGGAGGGIPGLGMAPGGGAAGPEAMHLEEIEKRCIMGALEKARFNHTRAADHLGVTRRTLGYRIQKYGLDPFVEEGLRRRREG